MPQAALSALAAADEMILYSLHPEQIAQRRAEGKVVPDGVPLFHGYEILGQTVLSAGSARQTVASALEEGVRNWSGRRYLCFDPRHGLRVTDASGTYEFVICFQCDGMDVQLPDGTLHGVGISSSGDGLNRLLQAAKVPLPTE